MKRSIILPAIAVVAASLVTGATGAGAKGKARKPAKPATQTLVVTCKTTLVNQPDPGENTVLPSDKGQQFGRLKCSRLGGGVIADTFTVPDSGDTVARFTRYYSAGTISGTFDITPDGGAQPDGYNFASQKLDGTQKITGGTGIYKGLKAKGKGKLRCSTEDSVHLTCKDTFTIVLPVAGS